MSSLQLLDVRAQFRVLRACELCSVDPVLVGEGVEVWSGGHEGVELLARTEVHGDLGQQTRTTVRHA
jgi:hypothetical protein